MKLTVVWISSAENDLADLWLAAADRSAVADAANELDRALRDSRQLEQLISRSEIHATVSFYPLKVLFRVDSDDCRVTVLAVARTETQ